MSWGRGKGKAISSKQDLTRMGYHFGSSRKPPGCTGDQIGPKWSPFRSVTNDNRFSHEYGEHCASTDPLPQTEMSAYNRILEILSRCPRPSLVLHLLYHLGEAAYCVDLVRRFYIVLQVTVLYYHLNYHDRNTRLACEQARGEQESDTSKPHKPRNWPQYQPSRKPKSTSRTRSCCKSTAPQIICATIRTTAACRMGIW